jgi:hypothetical protein
MADQAQNSILHSMYSAVASPPSDRLIGAGLKKGVRVIWLLKPLSGGLGVLLAIIMGLCMHACKNPSASDLVFNGKEDFADSAMSRVRIYKDGRGREMLQKSNTYYDIVDFEDRQDHKKMLLKITKVETSQVDSATTDNHFIVSVSNISGGNTGWKKEFTGSDLDYSNKVLIVHTEGRNPNEEDTYTQYSLLTGDKLMAYTYGEMMALIPSTSNKRFLGYLSKQSATADKPEAFAVISYVGSNEVLDKVAIKVKDGNDVPVYTPELKLLVAQESGNTLTNDGRTVILGHAGRTFTAKDINNFAMQINYYLPNASDPITILVPVRDDRLDIGHATFDKKIFELSKAN